MKGLIASSLVVLMTAAAPVAAPAMAQTPIKTELVALDGKSVDTISLRGESYSTWVIDNKNILYRDSRQDYYLVTLKEACRTLEIRSSRFDFHPANPWQLRASYAYEVRPHAGSPCEVARIAQLDKDRATPLRSAAMWRVW